MFITALFTTAKIQKQPMCPSTDNWVKKMRVRVCVCVLAQWNITSPCVCVCVCVCVCTCTMEYYFTIKRIEIMP